MLGSALLRSEFSHVGHSQTAAREVASFPDLFGAPKLAGLDMANDFIAEGEECELTAAIDAAGLEPFRFQQWTGKRLTRSYGGSYDFTTGRMETAEPIPSWLQPLKLRAASFAGLSPDELVQALVIRYDPGAGIGWHRDRPVFGAVVGISLGVPAAMRFRRRAQRGFERVAVSLPPRSVYKLAGEARHGWEHSIAAMAATRHSVTFRSLAGTSAT